MEKIEVSVICNAYNHAGYIRDALEGFVSQKTNFRFEVLVHDDASTDDTASIIMEYAEKYPDLIKPIIQSENKYSQGIEITDTYQIPRAQGEFIAICEGDDYWTDPEKLQIQYDAMMRHPEVDICAHASTTILATDNSFLEYIQPSDSEKIFTTEEVITLGGGFVATNSLFYRKSLLDNPPRFRRQSSLDYSMQIHGSLRGGMLYLPRNMSVYRFMVPGSWTARTLEGEYGVKEREKILTMLDNVNEDTGGRYKDEIAWAKADVGFIILAIKKDFKTMRKGDYRRVYKSKPLLWRFKTYIKQFLVHFNLY